MSSALRRRLQHTGDLAKAFQRSLTKQGMSFKLGSKVTAAASSKDGVELTVEPAAGGTAETLKGDVVLVAIATGIVYEILENILD